MVLLISANAESMSDVCTTDLCSSVLCCNLKISASGSLARGETRREAQAKERGPSPDTQMERLCNPKTAYEESVGVIVVDTIGKCAYQGGSEPVEC